MSKNECVLYICGLIGLFFCTTGLICFISAKIQQKRFAKINLQWIKNYEKKIGHPIEESLTPQEKNIKRAKKISVVFAGLITLDLLTFLAKFISSGGYNPIHPYGLMGIFIIMPIWIFFTALATVLDTQKQKIIKRAKAASVRTAGNGNDAAGAK